MVIVHHLNKSRSHRILWLLEELGVEYDIERYERDAETMLAPPALRAIHPLGKSPVISDGDRIVAESGAIIEYVVERYGQGRLVPAQGTTARLRYTYFLHYAEGSLMPPLLLQLIFQRIPRAPMPFFVRPIIKNMAKRVRASLVEPQLERHLDFLENELRERPWFAGDDFTAADIQMSFPLEAAASRAGLDARRPKLFGFLETIHARPAFQRAVARGGPYVV